MLELRPVAGVGFGAILVKLQCFYICAPQPPPPFFLLNIPINLKFIREAVRCIPERTLHLPRCCNRPSAASRRQSSQFFGDNGWWKQREEPPKRWCSHPPNQRLHPVWYFFLFNFIFCMEATLKIIKKEDYRLLYWRYIFFDCKESCSP